MVRKIVSMNRQIVIVVTFWKLIGKEEMRRTGMLRSKKYTDGNPIRRKESRNGKNIKINSIKVFSSLLKVKVDPNSFASENQKTRQIIFDPFLALKIITDLCFSKYQTVSPRIFKSSLYTFIFSSALLRNMKSV